MKFEHAVLVRGKEGSAPYKNFNGFFNAEQFNSQVPILLQIAIEKYFQTHMEEIRRTLGGLPVSVAVDVRYDTSGKLFDKEH